MPSKELLSAAERRFAARTDDRIGADVPDLDLEQVVARKDESVSMYTGKRQSKLNSIIERDDVTLRQEEATFLDDRRLAVGDDVIEPEYVVVATGSTLSVPPIPGIEEVPFESSADVFDTTEFPESGLVIGLGAIGLELVPYLSEAAGMDITAVEQLPAVLPDADPDPPLRGKRPARTASLAHHRRQPPACQAKPEVDSGRICRHSPGSESPGASLCGSAIAPAWRSGGICRCRPQ